MRQSQSSEARAQRQLCRGVPCPRCGAESNQKCIGSRGQPRFASHVERWQAFKPSAIGAQATRKDKNVRIPDYFDRRDADEDQEPRQPQCDRCGSTDVRWRQQGGKWVLFSLQPGKEHVCEPSADDFEVVPQ